MVTLNKWYPQFFDAPALLQKGNLDYVAGRGVVALHRDWDEPWQEHQPRVYKRSEDMARSAWEQNISRLFWHSLATETAEKSQPQKSTPILALSLACFRGSVTPQCRNIPRVPAQYNYFVIMLRLCTL